MAENIAVDALNTAIRGALNEYNRDVVAGLKKQTDLAMSDLVKQSKETAPVGNRSKHYKDSISSKTVSETEYGLTKLWYVKGSDYRLTHLLNNGHALRDGGRYPGTQFLSRAADKVVAEYVAAIEEVLNGGK